MIKHSDSGFQFKGGQKQADVKGTNAGIHLLNAGFRPHWFGQRVINTWLHKAHVNNHIQISRLEQHSLKTNLETTAPEQYPSMFKIYSNVPQVYSFTSS